MSRLKERTISWRFVLAFLLGSIFAEFTSDVLSDMLFFRRVGTGTPLSPVESVWYWYYLPALVYTAMFVAAYLLMKAHVVKPKHFVYALIFLAGIGMVASLKALGGSNVVAVMLLAPFLVLMVVLLYRRK
jgi:hypothetical protein